MDPDERKRRQRWLADHPDSFQGSYVMGQLDEETGGLVVMWGDAPLVIIAPDLLAPGSEHPVHQN
jgi:hypothetical protein